MLQHYVFIRFRDGTSPEHVTEFCQKMLALRERIVDVEHLEIGRDELRDARSWDLVLIMRFASVASLRAYQQHPEHRAIMSFNEPFLADIASVDFERRLA